MTDIRRIAVDVRPGVVRAALIAADGAVVEFLEERKHLPRLVGSVRLGRVKAVRAEMGAAFVDIGADADGFLNLKKGRKIAEGDTVAVRVSRDAEEGKGPLLVEVPDALPDGASALQPPAELIPAPPLPIRLLEVYGGGNVSFLCDDAETLAALKRHAETAFPGMLDRLERTAAGAAAFEQAGVAEAFAAALSPVVPLAGGGTLLIHETPAMATVDVNAGEASGGAGDRTNVQTNLAAAAALAAEVRRRGIGGLIAVDFLKMRTADNRDRVLAALRKALANDPAEPRTSGFGPFGVVEIARRRLVPSLAATNLRQTLGPAAETVALDALDAVRRRGGASASLRLNPAVADALKGPLAEALRDVEARLGFRVALDVRPDWPVERFDIE